MTLPPIDVMLVPRSHWSHNKTVSNRNKSISSICTLILKCLVFTFETMESVTVKLNSNSIKHDYVYYEGGVTKRRIFLNKSYAPSGSNTVITLCLIVIWTALPNNLLLRQYTTGISRCCAWLINSSKRLSSSSLASVFGAMKTILAFFALTPDKL